MATVVEHALPHVLQLIGSLVRSTQLSLQLVVGEGQAQLPPPQVMPPVQANVDPHPPQLLLLVCSLTQAPLHAL